MSQRINPIKTYNVLSYLEGKSVNVLVVVPLKIVTIYTVHMYSVSNITLTQ